MAIKPVFLVPVFTDFMNRQTTFQIIFLRIRKGQRGVKRPQKVTDSEMLENGVLLRYKGDDVVGITILDASKR
jgi:hypothetical protein